MHGLEPLRDAGEHLCSAGPIISKIDRLGNGANVFAKTANTGVLKANLMTTVVVTAFCLLEFQESRRRTGAWSNHGG
jgi:hypothetical protein